VELKNNIEQITPKMLKDTYLEISTTQKVPTLTYVVDREALGPVRDIHL